jgi:hypothetical protein
MHDSFTVGKLQPSCSLQYTVDRFGNGEGAVLLDQHRKVVALDVLHDEEVNAIGISRIVSGDNVRMIQLGRSFDLSLKAGNCCRIFHHGGREHLDRYRAIHAAMNGLEHLAHSTRPDAIKEGVFTQDQRFDLASSNLLSLELGEELLLVQFPQEFFGVPRVGLGRDGVFELVRSNNAGVG